MRELVVQTFLTLDGVMQAPGGPEEDHSGGFAHGGWSVNYWDEHMAQAMGEATSRPFAMVLGRKTYDIMAAHWPHSTEEAGAKTFNDATKYVASRGHPALEWNRGEPAPVASPTEQPTPQETLVSPTPPPPGGFAGHGEAYETVAQLARASDLIVVGTVERTRVASEIGEGPDDPFPTRILHTLVVVEEVFKGSEAEETVIVATDELGFQGPGVEDWRERGHRALLFLMHSRENASRYVPTGFAYPQAAYFVEDQQVEMTIGGDVNGLSERIAAMTRSELREKLRATRM